MLLVFAIVKKTPINSKLYRMQWLIFTTYLMHKNDVIPSNVKDTTDDIRKKMAGRHKTVVLRITLFRLGIITQLNLFSYR